MNYSTYPVVLTLSGLDPTGGAGLQADIEAIASMGAHAAPVATCLTVQNTSEVIEVSPVPAALLIEQARAVLEDMPVRSIKLGLLPDVEIIEAIHSILVDYPEMPVILDPVLASGAGNELTTAGVIDAMRNLLFPLTTLMTPNSLEARRLAPGTDTLEASAMALLDTGCGHVLITGTHEKSKRVTNTLYANHRKLDEYHWERLEGSYHGSGCTLASAIAGLAAQGQNIVSTLEPAQQYTWSALQQGGHLGMGQKLPQRFFWAGARYGH
jgi:hydroxymethylpyrimidine/phosphomethylpyrimidine kinase